MNTKFYLYYTFTCKILVTTANSWTLTDEGQCFYTVIAMNASSIITDNIVSCDYSEPYITFIISNTVYNNLTSDSINTNFNHWIRIIRAVNNTWDTVHSFTFRNFKNVLYVDLSGNNIKKIDTAFDGLVLLDSLSLARNQIQMIDTETFTITQNKTRLHLLDLSYNLLKYLPENLFMHVTNLRMLYLQGNQISTLHWKCFTGLKYLIYINLSDNHLKKWQFAMQTLSSSTIVDIFAKIHKDIS